MKFVRYLILAAVAFAVAGCVGWDTRRVNQVEATGNPFTRQLATEYRALANFEANQMADWVHADLFARKGIRAAQGEVVPPEQLSDWNLPANRIDELSASRTRLVTALDGNARTNKPVEAGIAQAKFDCWVEQQSENVQPDHIAACRDEFFAALAQLQPPPISEAAAVYFVFFDFDSAAITDAGRTIIAQVVSDFRAGTYQGINVVGHTDTVGSPAYNQRLSERRAAAVRQALVASGVPGNAISTSGVGERQLLVQTPDGVREPSNRRAEIRFR